MYFFYLGNNPDLSRWELENLLPSRDFVVYSTGIAYTDESLKDVDLKQIQKRAGGVREIVHFQDRVFNQWDKAIMSLRDDHIGDHKEITLHASSCDDKGREHMLKELKKYWHERTGKNLRFRLNKTYMLEQGGTVLWWLPVPDQSGNFWLGYTVSQQTITAYAQRDYDKPSRSMQRGMLPPKLAQIMINGAGLSAQEVLWDPFCGTGTVLVESALMHIPAIGSDNDSSAMRETQSNLQALLSSEERKYVARVWQQDVTRDWLLPEVSGVLVIVAEGYLGPVQQKMLTAGEHLRAFWQKVEPIYQKFFTQLNKSTIKKMVLASPIVLMTEGNSRLAKRSWDILTKQGWRMTFSSDYIRAGQFIGRHIACLQRN